MASALIVGQLSSTPVGPHHADLVKRGQVISETIDPTSPALVPIFLTMEIISDPVLILIEFVRGLYRDEYGGRLTRATDLQYTVFCHRTRHRRQYWFPFLRIPCRLFKQFVQRATNVIGGAAIMSSTPLTVELGWEHVGDFHPDGRHKERQSLYDSRHLSVFAPPDGGRLFFFIPTGEWIAPNWLTMPGLDFPWRDFPDQYFPRFKCAEELYEETCGPGLLDIPGARFLLGCVFLVTDSQYHNKSTLAVRCASGDGSTVFRYYPCERRRQTKQTPAYLMSVFFENFSPFTVERIKGTHQTTAHWDELVSTLPFSAFRGFEIAPPVEHENGCVFSPMVVGSNDFPGFETVTATRVANKWRYSGPLFLNTFSGLKLFRSPAPKIEGRCWNGVLGLLTLVYVDLCDCDMASFETLLLFLHSVLRRPLDPVSRLLVLYSKSEGVGKNNFLDNFGKQLVGEPHFRAVRERDLVGRFNSQIAGKVLVQCDEFNLNGAAEYSRLKSIVTGKYLMSEQKFQEPTETRAIASFVLTTNSLLQLGANDRRSIIIRCSERFDTWDRVHYMAYHRQAEEIYREAMFAFGHWLVAQDWDVSKLRGLYLPSQAFDQMREQSLSSSISAFIEGVRSGYTVDGTEMDSRWARRCSVKTFDEKFRSLNKTDHDLFAKMGVCFKDGEVFIPPRELVRASIQKILPAWGSGPSPTPPRPPTFETLPNTPMDDTFYYHFQHPAFVAALDTTAVRGSKRVCIEE